MKIDNTGKKKNSGSEERNESKEKHNLKDKEYYLAKNIELNSELIKKIEENKKSLERIKYLQASIQNMKKRHVREIEDINNYSITSFSKKLLTILDSIEEGIKHINNKESANIKTIEESLLMNHKIFLSVLEEFKIVQMRSDKQIFNPDEHEAISVMPDEKIDNNHIINTLQKGYTIGKRTLRTAKVIVCKNN